MRRMPARHIGGTLLAAVVGAVTGVSATTYGWLPVLSVLAAFTLGAATVRALYRANRKHRQINREELDADPFNQRLRVEYRDNPTDTGETR